MKFKKQVKKFIPPIIMDYISKFNRWRVKYYGLDYLDRRLEKYLNYTNGFYVELGANDGITQSNTAYFEKNKGWHGVLIEPTPHNYLKCLKNRSPKNNIYCNACVSFDYAEKFVEIAFSNLMSTPLNLESDVKDGISHANSGIKYLEDGERTFTFGAVAKTLNSILEFSKAPTVIDFLSLDVEGAEIEVLKGVNHDKYKFKYICIECRDEIKMSRYMKSQNYILLEKLSDRDYLYKNIFC